MTDSLGRSDVENRDWHAATEWSIRRYRPLFVAALMAGGAVWRFWLARVTFFNTDEAWHYSVANQQSLGAAYRASLSLAHPPLLIFILYFWKHLGTSDVMLRLPGILAGMIFCWILYRWGTRLFGEAAGMAGLVFATLLPPMIALSAELRQYTLMLMFAVGAAYFLERALAEDATGMMAVSLVSLYLAMLSHYSAFLFAAGLGIYAVARLFEDRVSIGMKLVWAAGQLVGVGLAALLYFTHIAKLGKVYPGEPLRRFGDYYLADVYFHEGKESLPHFLYRGTFGVFRFACGQRNAGHLTTILFLAGIALLFFRKALPIELPRTKALLLGAPFLVSWIAVIAGLYPYGRTRQCVFLAIFGIAGVSVALAAIVRNRLIAAVPLALAIVGMCHALGTPHTLDMLAFPEQRRVNMDAAMEFVRTNVAPGNVIFTDKPTSFQLQRYLCVHPPSAADDSIAGFESYACDGLRIISTRLEAGSLTPQSFPEQLCEMERAYGVSPASGIWVVQAAWSRGLGEALRAEGNSFSQIQTHVFDYYIEVFQIPTR